MISKSNISRFFAAAILTFLFSTVEAGAAVFKIGTLSPEGSIWMETMRKGAGLISEKTDNRVRFKFYPGGVMGSDQAVLRKMRIGQLQGGAVVAGSLSQIVPDLSIYALPFVFDSLSEVDYVRARMDSDLMKGMENHGYVGFGPAEGGFVYLMSKTPVRTTSDFSGRKVWIPENDEISLEAVKAFDVSPIPLSIGEVRTGLQTGMIDTIGTSPIGAIALQWHTQLNYLTDVPLLYVYAILILNKKDIEKLSLQDQEIVREILSETFDELDRINRRDNIEAMQALQNQGVEVVKISDETIKDWKRGVNEVPNELIKNGRLSEDAYNQLREHLDDFRSKHAGKRQ